VARDERSNEADDRQAGPAGRRAMSERTNPTSPAGRSGRAARHGRPNEPDARQVGPAEGHAMSERTNPTPGVPARLRYDDAYIKGILKRVKTIAAVGMSANDMRPSYFAMLYLQQKGYRMIPVNPRYAGAKILGETVVASLAELPAPPDMVQIFRKAEEAPAVVDEAIGAGAKVVWLQLGIQSDAAAAKARAAGLDVVMDRCPKIEYGRLFGEIGWAGVNRRVISAKKGQAVQLSHAKGGLARRPGPRQ
jgi:predicted CoA-binding protein